MKKKENIRVIFLLKAKVTLQIALACSLKPPVSTIAFSLTYSS